MSTASEVSRLLSELFKSLQIWASSKRIRYSLEANKYALKYMRRVERLDPELVKDKSLRRCKKKFNTLTTAQ